ncbi:hypothetical protein P5705_16005 [Pseudomonas entomophila]|uniref:hypothetical protein n=1 Tax=Pseudomonas entomophila TaxID=312306 RepID=UPI0024072CD0|nr:hypothetical protein [Pseudomonas entomophila]MDF9619151.1 hypothetical protein [Pseudomonas entomophila]
MIRSSLSLQNRIHSSNQSTEASHDDKNKYNNTTTIFHYNKNNESKDDVKIVINAKSHKSRNEDIQVLVGDTPRTFKSDKARHLLNMGNCFKDFPKIAMTHLERICSKHSGGESIIMPFVESRPPLNESNKLLNKIGFEKLSLDIKSALDTNPDLTKILIPVVEQGHWRLCILTKPDSKDLWQLIITETISRAKTTSLQNLKQYYSDLQNNILSSAEKALPGKTTDTFNYKEFKQYGERGCGITTSIIMEGILKGEIDINSNLYNDSDWISEHRDTPSKLSQLESILKEIETRRDTLIERYSNGLIDDEESDRQFQLLECERIETESNIQIEKYCPEESHLTLATNKSESSNITLEALRRVQLAFKLEKSFTA